MTAVGFVVGRKPEVHIRATFTIEIFAEDLADAAGHQRKLEDFLDDLRSAYSEADLKLTERRRRTGHAGIARGAPREITGRVNRYAHVQRH